MQVNRPLRYVTTCVNVISVHIIIAYIVLPGTGINVLQE